MTHDMTDPTPPVISAWDRHYQRDRSIQTYPDENLVRLLKKIPPGPALDLGCGSGRHLGLLLELGFSPVFGADTSPRAVEICRELYPDAGVDAIEESGLHPDHFRLAHGESSLRVVVLWGVLHYNDEALSRAILRECLRVLSDDGFLLGTLRAKGETHYAGNPDIREAPIHLYDQKEAESLLSSVFPRVELGYAERAPVGELERRVCHWIFRARKV